MAPRADLSEVRVDGWHVLVRAPAQNRVPFWTCTHEPCGLVVDLPHVTLTKAIAGKGTLPACTTCVPADERRAIDHGLHLACGTAHLIGTACPDGVQREPTKTAVSPGAAPASAESTPAPIPHSPTSWPLGEEIAPPSAAWALDGLDDSVTQVEIDAAEVRQLYYGHPSETVAPAITMAEIVATAAKDWPGAHPSWTLVEAAEPEVDCCDDYTCGACREPEALFEPLAPLGEFGIDRGQAPADHVEPLAAPAFDAEENARINERADWMPLDYFRAAVTEHKAEPEPAAHLADATTGALVVHGRADRLEAPQDVLDVIRRAMHGQERNHQSAPGPSQFGGCERRLGYHLATGIGNGSTDDGAWRPQVGTAVHAWLDEVFKDEPALGDDGNPRWLSSHRVTNPVAGTIDIADLQRRTAIDFKITGKTTRDKAARGEVSDKYEVQLDLYALGLINDGYPIETVALLLLPASGSLSEAVWYERPFDRDRALAAVARRDRINAMLSVAPMERVLPVLSTSDDFCGSCPAFGKHCEGFALPAVTPALRMVGGAA